MKGTLIDSNVLLDIVTNDDHWSSRSSKALEERADLGDVFINAVIYAEISVRFTRVEDVEATFPSVLFRRIDLPMEAAFLAGKAFLLYRQMGGIRTATLPDFFIGAHAAVTGLDLLTRDKARYSTYFPTINLIIP